MARLVDRLIQKRLEQERAGQMKIKVLDHVWSKLVWGDSKVLHPILSYKDTIYVQKGFRKVPKEFMRPVIDRHGRFLTGYIPKIKDFCEKNGIALSIEDFQGRTLLAETPNLPGITFRNDQQQALIEALQFQRGIIWSPTGSGKTIMGGGIISAFPSAIISFIVNGKDLLHQTAEEFERFFPGDVGIIGDSRMEPNRITICMIQTLNRLGKTDWHDEQNGFLIDECHHVSTFEGSYAKVIQFFSKAEIRMGLTATLPYLPEAILAAEGLIGPVIAEVKLETLIEEGILAKPKLKFYKLNKNPHVKALRKYQDVYSDGVVNNRSLNKKVLEVAQEFVKEGMTVLVLVVRRDHGENIERMAANMFPDLKLKYVHGESEGEERQAVIHGLKSGELEVAIATVIFNEGINIPSLGAIINAAGGKSEIATIQKLGRGLRTTDDKKEVHLIDFFNPSHHFLIDHFGERLSLYFDLGWL